MSGCPARGFMVMRKATINQAADDADTKRRLHELLGALGSGQIGVAAFWRYMREAGLTDADIDLYCLEEATNHTEIEMNMQTGLAGSRRHHRLGRQRHRTGHQRARIAIEFSGVGYLRSIFRAAPTEAVDSPSHCS